MIESIFLFTILNYNGLLIKMIKLFLIEINNPVSLTLIVTELYSELFKRTQLAIGSNTECEIVNNKK